MSAPIKELIFSVRTSVQYFLIAPFKIVDDISEFLVTHRVQQEENNRLKAENLKLRARLQTFSALFAENERLHAALGASSPFAHQMALAELIAIVPDPFSHRATLNKGKKQGVYVGQPVVDAKGIMGQIVYVSDTLSEAIFITDPHHGIPATVLRNGIRVLVMGTGSLNQLDVPFVQDASSLKIGDLLVASSLGTHFPPGYPIAKITSISHEAHQPFALVSAKPLAELDRSQQVFLIWPK